MNKLLICLMALLCSALVSIDLHESVISSGFQYSDNETIHHQETLGQTNTELMSNSDSVLHSGFWQPMVRPQETGIQGYVTLVSYSSPGAPITNVSLAANGITVHPDLAGHFQIALLPGSYTLSASLPGYNPIEITGISINSSGYTSQDLTLADWTPISGTQYSMLLLANVLLDTNILTGANGNLLAAFGPDGNQDCRGVGTWIPELSMFYMDIVGNVNGQTLSFRFINQSNGQISNCNETITFSDNATIGSFDTPFTLHLSLGNISNIVIQKSGNNAVLTWDGPTGVMYYVYKSDKADTGFSLLSSVTGRTYTDINALSNQRRFYRVTFEQ